MPYRKALGIHFRREKKMKRMEIFLTVVFLFSLLANICWSEEALVYNLFSRRWESKAIPQVKNESIKSQENGNLSITLNFENRNYHIVSPVAVFDKGKKRKLGVLPFQKKQDAFRIYSGIVQAPAGDLDEVVFRYRVKYSPLICLPYHFRCKIEPPVKITPTTKEALEFKYVIDEKFLQINSNPNPRFDNYVVPFDRTRSEKKDPPSVEFQSKISGFNY